MNVLTLNAGSSSLKTALYRFGDSGGEGELVFSSREPSAAAVIAAAAPMGIDAVAIRVVHGGARFLEPVVVDDEVLAGIGELSELAPLHNPLAVAVIEAVRGALPQVPIVAVFDTAFHSTLPPVAFTLAVPSALGVRRWGFHGISYAYVARRLDALGAGQRVIAAHLGSGASVCAMLDGRSIDTSMGLTPMEGLVMGTRSGDIDPGVLLYLLRKGRDEPSLDDLLNHDSGLLGVSGTTGDVRELEEAARSGDKAADLALDLFAYRASKYIASYCAVLGGVDALVFTAGIGENSASMRARICERLGFLGIELDAERNNEARKDERSIHSGPTAVFVVPTNEELEMGRSANQLLMG